MYEALKCFLHAFLTHPEKETLPGELPLADVSGLDPKLAALAEQVGGPKSTKVASGFLRRKFSRAGLLIRGRQHAAMSGQGLLPDEVLLLLAACPCCCCASACRHLRVINPEFLWCFVSPQGMTTRSSALLRSNKTRVPSARRWERMACQMAAACATSAPTSGATYAP